MTLAESSSEDSCDEQRDNRLFLMGMGGGEVLRCHVGEE